MKNLAKIVFCFTLFSLIFSCEKSKDNAVKNGEEITILIQPFEDVKPKQLAEISENIRKIYPKIKILEPIDFPKNAFYQPRNRYRADSIIKYLRTKTPNNCVTLALTNKDISVTKGKVADFGVMGLGYRPGNACVASSFRLNPKNKNEQFYKIAIHELGHTQGLKHCPDKTCFMRDAEGKNPTNEEKDFCQNCKKVLRSKHWKI
jgi:archaemetzincin